MTSTPRDFEGALLYLRQQHRHLDPPAQYGSTWHNDCQALAHVEYGIMEGGNPTAYAQWLNTSPHNRHIGGSPSAAPPGALHCSKGSSVFGHIWTEARPFASGVSGAWSPDMNVHVFGGVAKVRSDAPMTQWGHRYLGWITEINGYELDLTHTKKPAKPMQDKRYQRLGTMIEGLGAAIETAKKDHDKSDIEALRKQREAMKRLYGRIRHS